MISCYVRYTIDPHQLDAFEAYARAWIAIVDSMGGTHHGYFLPEDTGSDVAVALFSFPSRADFDAYRRRKKSDPGCRAAFEIAERAGCVIHYEGRFMRPILPDRVPSSPDPSAARKRSS